MIKIELTEIAGWEPAIRGMRNAMNSWDKSDSVFYKGAYDTPYNICGRMMNPDDNAIYFDSVELGPNDAKLMMNLRNSGTPDHRKYMRMIVVWMDITAPLYWWKEFDTYKVGTVANSCSTMHKIHEKEFTLDDFSTEHLLTNEPIPTTVFSSRSWMGDHVRVLNIWRELYIKTKDKKYWWQMIQLLPSSYNQRRTVMLNYEVLANMYRARKSHKLDEWREFCKWIEGLPYSELITGKEKNDG